MHGRDVAKSLIAAAASLALLGCTGTEATSECETLRANHSGQGESYPCFAFEAPFGADDTVTGWWPQVDDEAVHHFVLYRTSADVPIGPLGDCDIPDGSEVVAAWSPGNDGIDLPEGVGLELARPGDRLLMQMHYVGPVDTDRSGIQICAAPGAPIETAGTFVLGTPLIQIPAGATDHEILHRCMQRQEQPLTAIAASPHMHRLGRAVDSRVLRGGPDGPEESIVEVDPFDYDRQVTHVLEPAFVIQPGDIIETRCRYDNPGEAVGYGITIDDEMCFNYLTVYPIEAFEADQVRFCY
jgi:hypothetical protein